MESISQSRAHSRDLSTADRPWDRYRYIPASRLAEARGDDVSVSQDDVRGDCRDTYTVRCFVFPDPYWETTAMSDDGWQVDRHLKGLISIPDPSSHHMVPPHTQSDSLTVRQSRSPSQHGPGSLLLGIAILTYIFPQSQFSTSNNPGTIFTVRSDPDHMDIASDYHLSVIISSN